MDDCLCMYQDSPGRLRRIDYYNRVESFINYALSNMRNISGGSIRCLFKRCKNKKFLDLDVVTMHLLQKKSSWKKYLYRFAHGEPYVPYKTTI
jgi:hypothetical protein